MPAGIGALALSAALLLLTSLLGPSAMQPTLPGSAVDPPYSLDAHPPPVLTAVLTAAGILTGTLGLWLCLRTLRSGLGWITPRRLLLAGGAVAAAFALLPPTGSGDHLNYAAYGHMLVEGHDPYATAARDLPGDPVADAVEPPWREEPSLYGPVATVQQAFAAAIGGDSVRLIVFVMSLTNLIAFLGVGLLLHRMAGAGGGPRRQLRAALMWTANPLLLYLLVGGAHNDVIAICLVVAGLAVVVDRGADSAIDVRRCVLGGLLIGLGAAVKLNVALVAAGPVLALIGLAYSVRDGPPAHSRDPDEAPPAMSRPILAARLAAFCGGCLGVLVMAYALAGPHAFDQLRRASKSVSLATPWHLVAGPGGGLLGTDLPRQTVQMAWLLLALVLSVLLLRGLPRFTGQDWPRGGETAVRVAAALALAWLFATPYALPWYDGLGWALLALVPASRFDGLLLIRSAALALAYLPARDPKVVDLPDWLVTVWRAEVTPWALTLLLTVLIATSFRGRRVRAPAR